MFAVFNDFLFGQGIIFCDHKDFDFFAHGLVRNADSGGLADFGVACQEVIDFLGINIFPAADDHVFHPVHNENIPVRVLHAHVSGMQIPVDDGFGGFLGLVVIAFHDIIALDDDFTAFSRGHFLAVFIHNQDFLAGQGQADGADFANPHSGIDGGNAGAFRESVSFHNGNLEGVLESGHGFLGQGGRAADAEFKGA